jgi:hypothetical protein
MKTIVIGANWRKTNRVSHLQREIPKSVRIALISYAEENEPRPIELISQELNIPNDLITRYCQLLGISYYCSEVSEQEYLCGFVN